MAATHHYAMFRYIRRTDRVLLLLNVLFLLLIAFVPFTIAVLADYLPGAHEHRPAAVVYGAWFFVVELAFNAVWRYGIAGAASSGPASTGTAWRRSPGATASARRSTSLRRSQRS